MANEAFVVSAWGSHLHALPPLLPCWTISFQLQWKCECYCHRTFGDSILAAKTGRQYGNMVQLYTSCILFCKNNLSNPKILKLVVNLLIWPDNNQHMTSFLNVQYITAQTIVRFLILYWLLKPLHIPVYSDQVTRRSDTRCLVPVLSARDCTMESCNLKEVW